MCVEICVLKLVNFQQFFFWFFTFWIRILSTAFTTVKSVYLDTYPQAPSPIPSNRFQNELAYCTQIFGLLECNISRITHECLSNHFKSRIFHLIPREGSNSFQQGCVSALFMQLDFNIANIRVYQLFYYFIKQTRFSSKNKLIFENISAKKYI